MITTEIELKYNRKHFEEMYFRNGGEKILFHRNFKKEFYTVTAMGCILIVLLIYNIITDEHRAFLVIAIIIFCLTSIDLYKKVAPAIVWKKEITNYLNGLDKIKKNKIIVTPYSFSLIQDGTEIIEKWTEFKRTEINETFIYLVSNNSNYSIPKKSMTTEEFDFLQKFICEKIKLEQ